MENLQDSNLISGVVASEHANATNEAQTPDNTLEERIKLTVKEMLDGALESHRQQLAEAEQRGFHRALEMARNNPETLGISRSVPNFLTDVRPDIWEA